MCHRRAFNDQRELSLETIGVFAQPSRSLAQSASVHLFEEFGQLAADHDLSVWTKRGVQGVDGVGDPVRRLVQHQTRRHRAQCREFRIALRCLGRQKADEQEAIVGHAAGRECGQCRRRTGQRNHPQPCRMH